MAQFAPDESKFSDLKDAVVVISGAATGIGASTVKTLSAAGCNVVLGDLNIADAEKTSSGSPGVSFVPCDVTKYEDIYNLFKSTHDRFGRVDHAISCAGIFERGNWFDPGLSIDSVREDPGDLQTLNVNVIGSLHFARIAAVFLRQGRREGQDRSLTLLSSVNAFRESPGLYLYQTGKHAVHGLLRSSRKILYERDGIRVNAVCPGVTDTPMAKDIARAFREAGLFTQSPESVAKIIVGIKSTPSIIGKAFYIEGGDGWEFEDSFYAAQPQWLGEEPTRRMRFNSEAVQKGALIPK